MKFIEFNENLSATELIQAENFDAVIHLATTYDLNEKWQNIEKMIDSNYKLMLNILCALDGKQTPLITAGSFTQHLSDKSGPTSVYALLKDAATTACEFFAAEKEIKIIELRFFDTYGPGDTRNKFIDLLVKAGKDNKSLDASLGEQLIDLVHIDDVVRAFKIAIEQLAKTEIPGLNIYEISSRSPLTLKKLALKVEEKIGHPISVNWGHYPYRKYEMFSFSSKYPLLPNWNQSVQIEDGIDTLLSEFIALNER